MAKLIIKYQKAFNSIISKLQDNENVLGVMVLGSMVTGDLWEESDIDLFVIVNDKINGIKNIYTEENGISVHIKLLSKDEFLRFYENNINGSLVNRVFISSKLVFSKDSDITNRFNSLKYYLDIDREKWNLVYLGALIKNISVCKKYFTNNGIYTAYSLAIRCIEEFARLYVNHSGYMVSKDAATVASSLNNNFKEVIDDLIHKNGDCEILVSKVIKFIEEYIEKNIKNCCIVLLKYLKEKQCALSSEELKNDTFFQEFDIQMEEILNELHRRNIIKKDFREFKLNCGKILVAENVYSYNTL
ncbi:nucleotidyltransferase [Clostridium polyendosporum]|uniref:Nucleotidyltransferase n=1 Tax=Clostridium polyendosporum TaxID=69208 RepID=A0A919RZF4_9CLOT|nr:nucleotidyltransferase domain-containing protein [Clostridium polyendosporum]GIM28624.1 nucleotidyltransferase [Clostridium polyendosporum]